MNISELRRATFERLRRAIKSNQVALLECRGEDDKSLAAVCTVTDLGEGLMELQPFALMLDEQDFHDSRLIVRRRDDVRLN